jgi:hypothetical protein
VAAYRLQEGRTQRLRRQLHLGLIERSEQPPFAFGQHGKAPNRAARVARRVAEQRHELLHALLDRAALEE